MSERADPVGIISGWALLGGTNALTLDLFRRMTAVEFELATPSVLVGAGIGCVAWAAVRHRERWDPAVAVITWGPVALGIPSLVALGVVGTVAADDPRIWWVSGLGVIGLSELLRRGLSRQILSMAITRDFEGDPAWLNRLVEARLVSRAVKDHARYALALRHCRSGEPSQAIAELATITSSSIAPLALILQALIHEAQGDTEVADQLLLGLPSTRRSRTMLRQAEAVRALQAVRRGETPVISEDAVPLTRALSAWSHWKQGELEEAFDLLDPTTRHSLTANGLGVLIVEVGEILAAMP